MIDDFFRARLEQMIYLKHPLAVLTSRRYAEQDRDVVYRRVIVSNILAIRGAT